MLREEVKVELATGLAHDHSPLSTTTRRHQQHHNQRHHKHQHHSQHLLPTTPTNYPQLQAFSCLGSIQDKTNIQQQQPAATAAAVASGQQESDTLKQDEKQQQNNTPALSTIAILRRHPMFDSLVLVKKYRACLQGHTLEFPTTSKQQVDDDDDDDELTVSTNSIVPQIFSQLGSENAESTKELSQQQQQSCNRTKLVSVYLDGDDPIFQSQAAAAAAAAAMVRKTSNEPEQQQQKQQSYADIVYVPINGLLDRLDNYNRQGFSIDSRVYAFAMGLKTAERFLTSSSEKEIQEAPQL